MDEDREVSLPLRHGSTGGSGKRPRIVPDDMPKKGNRKRLKFKAGGDCPESVTVADYADADPAVVKSGRVKKAVVNAVEKEVKSLCGLEASLRATEEVLSGDSDEDHDPSKDEENGATSVRKKKKKRRKESSESGDGIQIPGDIWLVLSSYIRPEDVGRFSLICKRAWMVTCTAAFWTRLYRRHYKSDAVLPWPLQPDSITVMRCLRAHVIRSLFFLYEPFAQRVARIPVLPDSTPTFLINSKCLLSSVQKVSGSRPEELWEFSFKFTKQDRSKQRSAKALCTPRKYQDVHTNPESDCYALQISTLNFIFTPVVMGMTLTLFNINVSADMRHHRVRLLFHDSPVLRGKKTADQSGTMVVLDPVHSVKLMDWWHPEYPFSSRG